MAQLLDQHLLDRRRRARKKSRKIGAELGACDDCNADRDACEPCAERPARCQAHVASRVMVITERSPPASRISMTPTQLLLPLTRISLATSRMRGCVGLSRRRHWLASPSRLTW